MADLTIAQWVHAAIASKGITQAELARQLQRVLRRSFDRSMVYKILKGERDVSAEELVAIERITEHPVPSVLRPELMRVPLISWASAGLLLNATSKIPTDEAPPVTFANQGPGDYFALRVAGDAMDRVSPDGAVILVDRAQRELVDGRFYIFAGNPEPLYRRWHATPARLVPLSTNATYEATFPRRRTDAGAIGRVLLTILDL